jgi:mannose-6-phosphate isomerase
MRTDDADDLGRFALDRLLPLCRDRFADPAHGGFHERLDADGAPLPLGTKRLMVQCRQIYVLSHAALLGDRSGSAAALAGYRFLRRAYHDDRHGGWYFQASAAGAPVDRHKDLYGHAFVLFMLAYLHRAFGDQPEGAEAPALAGRTMDILQARLAAPHGGYWDRASEDWQPDRTLRRQNPHMHLLEAMLALFEATGERRWLDEADALVALLETRFFDAATGTLGEFFTADWSADPVMGHMVEPGHHFEWLWLLHRYADLTGRAVPPAADTMFATAMRFGFDAGHGGIIDQHHRDGTALLRSRRIWTTTEAIKAHAVRQAAGLAAQPGVLIAQLFRDFLRPAKVGWIETMRADGTVDMTALPGSTPYHLFVAGAEVLRLEGAGKEALLF